MTYRIHVIFPEKTTSWEGQDYTEHMFYTCQAESMEESEHKFREWAKGYYHYDLVMRIIANERRLYV
jgi:hypothetical protein